MTQLALRLWQQAESSVRPGDLRDEAAMLIPRLTVADMDAAMAAHQLGSGTLLVRDEEGRFRFIHQSVMEWLVARRAAETLTTGDPTALLAQRTLSPLMADFLVALVVEQEAALRDWVRNVLDVAATEGEVVKKNALLINKRLGDPVRLGANLAGQDLRGQDLSGRDLAWADLRGADLRDTRLAGADLTGARLAGARLAGADLSRAILRDADLEGADGAGTSLLGADLSGARLAGSRWPRAKLVATRLEIQTLPDCKLWGAARPEADRPDLQYIFANPCTSVAWHPIHPILVTGHASGSMRLWDPESGRALRTLEGHGNAVLSVAVSPDGKCLASGSRDKTVRLWDPESGHTLRTLEGHESAVRSVAFSPDSKCLASGSWDNTVRLWDPASGQALHTLEGHGDWVGSVAFSPDGKCLASGSG
ncbi:MAG: WD40 repeat domain-containing protein, partial [Gammaproteobacteria bacterium]